MEKLACENRQMLTGCNLQYITSVWTPFAWESVTSLPEFKLGHS